MFDVGCWMFDVPQVHGRGKFTAEVRGSSASFYGPSMKSSAVKQLGGP
jgi:hypothetical protein